jgi:hypothetical protein
MRTAEMESKNVSGHFLEMFLKGLVLIFTQNALFGEKVVLAAKMCEVIKTSTCGAGYSGLTTRPARL